MAYSFVALVSSRQSSSLLSARYTGSLASCVPQRCSSLACHNKCRALILPGARSDRYLHEGALWHLIDAQLRESRGLCHPRILCPGARNSTGSQSFLGLLKRLSQLSNLVPTSEGRFPQAPSWSLSPALGRRVAIPASLVIPRQASVMWYDRTYFGPKQKYRNVE